MNSLQWDINIAYKISSRFIEEYYGDFWDLATVKKALFLQTWCEFYFPKNEKYILLNGEGNLFSWIWEYILRRTYPPSTTKQTSTWVTSVVESEWS